MLFGRVPQFEEADRLEIPRDTVDQNFETQVWSIMFEKLKRFFQSAEEVKEPATQPVVHEEKEEALQVEIVEKKETLSSFRVQTYKDLRDLHNRRPPLPTESEYPPQPRKIRAISIDEIMAIYADAICQAAEELPMSEAEIDDFFMPVVRHALMFMHLLPASQFNHHNGVGGLFAHSLQVGTMSVQLGKRKVFNRRDTPRQLYANGKRWLFGCWLSGFLHDIGKPGSDVLVTSEGDTWYAYSESLMSWLDLNNKTEYSFIWKSAGHNKHQQSTLLFVKEIVPTEVFTWLAEFGSREIWEACEIALTNPAYIGPNSLIAEVVMQADRFVSGEDIKKRNTGAIDSKRMGGGAPAADFILDAIRLMVSENELKVNEKGSFLFVTNIGTFIIWSSKTAERIYARLLEEKHTSVPRQADRMLDCLVFGGVVETAPESISKVSSYYWPLVIDAVPTRVFRAIKLRSNFSIFNGLVTPEPCLAIINGYAEQAEEVVKAWEAKHGVILNDKALADSDVPCPVLPSDLSGAVNDDRMEVDKAYANFVQEEQEKNGSAETKPDENFMASLRQILTPPVNSGQSENSAQNEQAQEDLSEAQLSTSGEGTGEPAGTLTVEEAKALLSPPKGVTEEPVTDISSVESNESQTVRNPSPEAPQQIKDDPAPDNLLKKAMLGEKVVVPEAVAEQEKPVPLTLKPVSEEKRVSTEITVLSPPSAVREAAPLCVKETSSSGEEKESTESQAALDDEAVIDEEPYKATSDETIRTFATRKRAEIDHKRQETLARKTEELSSNEQEVKIVFPHQPKTESDCPDKTSLERPEQVKKEAFSGRSLAKLTQNIRLQIIDDLINASENTFPEGVEHPTDDEYSGFAERIFDQAAKLGLDRVKVRRIQQGFQPGEWQIIFTEKDKRTVVTIRRKGEH